MNYKTHAIYLLLNLCFNNNIQFRLNFIFIILK